MHETERNELISAEPPKNRTIRIPRSRRGRRANNRTPRGWPDKIKIRAPETPRRKAEADKKKKWSRRRGMIIRRQFKATSSPMATRAPTPPPPHARAHRSRAPSLPGPHPPGGGTQTGPSPRVATWHVGGPITRPPRDSWRSHASSAGGRGGAWPWDTGSGPGPAGQGRFGKMATPRSRVRWGPRPSLFFSPPFFLIFNIIFYFRVSIGFCFFCEGRRGPRSASAPSPVFFFWLLAF